MNILSDSSQEFVDGFAVSGCGPPLNQACSHASLAVSDNGHSVAGPTVMTPWVTRRRRLTETGTVCVYDESLRP